MTLLFIRFYLLGITAQEGDLATEIISNMVSHWVVLSEKNIQEYWKISEYLEVSMKFYFKDEFNLDLKFQEITKILGTGWIYSSDIDDKSAVWNFGDNNFFIVPKTQWAIVEI